MKDDMLEGARAMPQAPAVAAPGTSHRMASPRRRLPDAISWAVGTDPRDEPGSPVAPGGSAGAGGTAGMLGSVLLARSARGVCAILIGEGRSALVAELARYFPDAVLREDAVSLAGPLADWWAFLETPSRGFRHPLDVAGTPLQQQVWQALQSVPAGATLTYSDLAARLGRPRAVRAVASACAANRLAVVIPCHRVIGRNGSLTGYRWGIDRKRSLLEMEARG